MEVWPSNVLRLQTDHQLCRTFSHCRPCGIDSHTWLITPYALSTKIRFEPRTIDASTGGNIGEKYYNGNVITDRTPWSLLSGWSGGKTRFRTRCETYCWRLCCKQLVLDPNCRPKCHDNQVQRSMHYERWRFRHHSLRWKRRLHSLNCSSDLHVCYNSYLFTVARDTRYM